MQVNERVSELPSLDPSRKVITELKGLLATNYSLYLRTQNYHWNVEGPLFHSLHKLLEEQYQRLALFNDDIAERIRALDEKAPGSYEEFGSLSSLKVEKNEKDFSTKQMLDSLIDSYNVMIGLGKQLCETADQEDDPPSNDLATELLSFYEQARWMLKSIQKGK